MLRNFFIRLIAIKRENLRRLSHFWLIFWPWSAGPIESAGLPKLAYVSHFPAAADPIGPAGPRSADPIGSAGLPKPAYISYFPAAAEPIGCLRRYA